MGQFATAGLGRAQTRIRFGRLRLAAVIAALAAIGALAPNRLTEKVDASESALEDHAHTEIIVTDEHTTLELSGPIVFGVTRRVRSVLDAHPTITTLRLTSPGGRVVEARDLSAIVAERGLTTVAVGNCASACTVLFMAGRERLLAPTTTLGFHRYHSPDARQAEAEENMAIDRRYFRARGIPAWFVERAFTTPNSGMWRPSLDEMKVANVITGELTEDGRRVTVRAASAAETPGAMERAETGSLVNASEQTR